MTIKSQLLQEIESTPDTILAETLDDRDVNASINVKRVGLSP